MCFSLLYKKDEHKLKKSSWPVEALKQLNESLWRDSWLAMCSHFWSFTLRRRETLTTQIAWGRWQEVRQENSETYIWTPCGRRSVTIQTARRLSLAWQGCFASTLRQLRPVARMSSSSFTKPCSRTRCSRSSPAMSLQPAVGELLQAMAATWRCFKRFFGRKIQGKTRKNKENTIKYKEFLAFSCIFLVFPCIFLYFPTKKSFKAAPRQSRAQNLLEGHGEGRLRAGSRSTVVSEPHLRRGTLSMT